MCSRSVTASTIFCHRVDARAFSCTTSNAVFSANATVSRWSMSPKSDAYADNSSLPTSCVSTTLSPSKVEKTSQSLRSSVMRFSAM